MHISPLLHQDLFQDSKMNNIRELFLRNFVLSLIKNIPVKESYNKEAMIENIKPTYTSPIEEFIPSTPQLPSLPPIKPIVNINMKNKLFQQSPQIRMQYPFQMPTHPQSFSIKQGFTPSIVSDVKSPAPNPLILSSAFAKINNLLKDPSIQSIECTGQGKPILVNKSGLIQTSNVILTKDEISSILEEISDKTKIPLIQGLFKAMLGNLIITAVISDFVGTRFIMQKKVPLHPTPIRL